MQLRNEYCAGNFHSRDQETNPGSEQVDTRRYGVYHGQRLFREEEERKRHPLPHSKGCLMVWTKIVPHNVGFGYASNEL